MKLRNAVASQEFIVVHVKKYLHDENMRMVYKILGMPVPKLIKDKLAEKGVEFIEHWPAAQNSMPTHETFKSSLGLIEMEGMTLKKDVREQKEKSGPSKTELEFTL